MKTLLILLFGLVIASKTGLCQQNEEELTDYNNDEENDYDNGGGDDGSEDSDSNRPAPRIMSTPQNIAAKAGSTVELPCKIENPENALVEWWFNKIRISMDDEIMIDGDRYSLKKDVLVINSVNESDTGNYSCFLLNEKQKLTHRLSVSAPVRIYEFYTTRDNTSLPDDRSHTSHAVWLKGSRQQVYCTAKGYPVPSVVISHLWMHGKHKSGQVETLVGNPITIDPVERKHAGKYICSASNEVTSVEKSLQVEVEYAPEVHLKKEYIATAEGRETTILCRVQAHPQATVHWMRYNDRLDKVNRELYEDREGANHILKIRNTKESDFGVYTCIASNSLGSANKTVRVSGEPSKPVIQSADIDQDEMTPVLTWKTESLVPLMEYKLEYKKQEANDWYDVKKSPEIHELNVDSIFIIKHKFEDLEEGTYHARIKAKNQYGWSENSAEKIFSGNKMLLRSANSFSQLESIRQNSGAELRTSLVFVLSLLAAHLLH